MTENLLLFALCFLITKAFRGVQKSTTCRGFQYAALFSSFVILFFGASSLISKYQLKCEASAYNIGFEKGYDEGYDKGFNESIDMNYDTQREAGVVLKEFLGCSRLINLIFGYCDNPIGYLYNTYEPYWGNLTRYEGDLVLSELTPKQQLLVNYPYLFENCVYCVSAGKKTYHSIYDCYILLKTPFEDIKESTLQDAKQNGYEPCSRCIDLSIEKPE